MAAITYTDSKGTSRTVEGEDGSTVMETAIRHKVPEIVAECGGACACATCHVYIDEAWMAKVGKPSGMEEDMLDFAYDVKPTSRLSCQIKVTPALDGLQLTTRVDLLPCRLDLARRKRASVTRAFGTLGLACTASHLGF